jgi:hypothetical protein
MRRMQVILAPVLVLPLLLAGCALFGPRGPTETPEVKDADRESTAAREECQNRRTMGELTLVQTVACANPRIVAAFERAHYPYMDLLRLGMDARLAGAEKVDRGEISETVYMQQLRELRERIADEMSRRNESAVAAGWPEKDLPAATYPETADATTREAMLHGLDAFGSLMP